MMVDIGSDFSMHCMMADRWREPDIYWLVYFTLTSIYCQLYPVTRDINSTCTEPYDLDRFSVSNVAYMMVLDVQAATINDTGLYVCSRPAYFLDRKPTGHVALVGIVCKFLRSLFLTNENLALYRLLHL